MAELPYGQESARTTPPPPGPPTQMDSRSFFSFLQRQRPEKDKNDNNEGKDKEHAGLITSVSFEVRK